MKKILAYLKSLFKALFGKFKPIIEKYIETKLEKGITVIDVKIKGKEFTLELKEKETVESISE